MAGNMEAPGFGNNPQTLCQPQLITQNHGSIRFWFMLAIGHGIVMISA